jgi:hypothetical protein
MNEEQTLSSRDVVFISHAYPEDNEFTLWLATQLATAGYPVWCDLTDLLGGEDFWRSVERVIRHRAVIVLFVLSKNSNSKEGTLQEIALAKAVAKQIDEEFLIPLKIDDLPREQINIELRRINFISFEASWAKGLHTLLDKLDEKGVQKQSNYGPDAVAAWWRTNFSADKGLKPHPEELLSNWFVFDALPPKLLFHILPPGSKLNPQEIGTGFSYQIHGNGILSFASAEDFALEGIRFGDTHDFLLADLLNDEKATFIDSMQTRNVITSLLTQAWELYIKQRGLDTYRLANGMICGYFKTGQLEKDKITFNGVDGKSTWRRMIGYKSVKSRLETDKKRYWHFAISAKPHLRATKFFSINPHVLFSDDGTAIWTDTDKMHRAKMRQCKNWWNDDWRDRLLAFMNWLANENGEIKISLSSQLFISVSSLPLVFTSPIQFNDPTTNQVRRGQDEGREDA